MFSLLTGLLSSLAISTVPDAPALVPQYCTCVSLYPDVFGNLCKKCGNLKSAEECAPEEKEETSFVASRASSPNIPRVKTRRVEPTKPDGVQYLNRKLTASLTSIANDPVFLARKGPLAVFGNGESLYDYQAIDLQRMLECEAEGKGTILAYGMGLGKTVTSAALICSSRSRLPGAFRTTLVIAPNIGILQHWRAELKRFAPKLEVLLYHGDGRKGDPRVPDVTLASLSEVRNQWAAYTDENVSDESKFILYTGKFKRIIIDEAQTIRNPETASAKACWALKKYHGLCLSGTPAQNKLEDLFALLKFLDVQSEGLNDLPTFRSRVTDPYKTGEIAKPTELLVRVLTECMIYRPKDFRLAGIQLPKLHDAVVLCIELTPAERAVYDYIKSVHPFSSPWAKVVRLRQAADHPALLTKALHRGDIGPKPDHTSDQMRVLLDQSCAEANEVIAQDTPLGTLPPCLEKYAQVFKSTYISSKFDALLRILKQIPRGEKILIFSHFLTNLDMMAGLLSEKGISYARYDGRMGPSERAAALDQIQTEKRCTVLLMSIMAGGTGLDIPVCNHVILVEPWWNPYVEDQAISRVHRIGQLRQVRVYKLLVKDSVEDSIVKTQNAKREVIGGLLSLCTVPDATEMGKWLA